MKKILVLLMTLLFITGCGMSKEEKESMLYKSLEKAFISIYASEGIGFAVYEREKVEVDGKNWYMVAISKYDNLDKINNLASSVYKTKLAENINEKVAKRYKEIDGALYTEANGGCSLDFNLDDNLRDKIKESVNIKKVKMNKIVFEYKGKEYTGKKKDKYYVFDEKIFECNSTD